MRRSRILPVVGGLVAWACLLPVRASAEPGSEAAPRPERVAEAQNTFRGASGGIRIIDAGSGLKGSLRLGLQTEFFVIRSFFVPSDQAHHFAGNLSLSATPTEYLEVFASAEVTSAWDDSNDPLLIQRVADLWLGVKGFHQVKPWLTVGGDASLLFPGGVGDLGATFRATSFGFRANVRFDFRRRERRQRPLILRFNAGYWFDNTANLTEGIEDERYDALGGSIPPSMETRHLLTAFERFAYGMNRVDTVRLAAGFEVPLRANRVGIRPLLEWQWDIPVDRQGYRCASNAAFGSDGCLDDEGLAAFPMLLTLGLRILPPPRGLAFTVAADVGLTGARTFVQELAPTVPYNIILGIGYAFDLRPASVPSPSPPAVPTPVVTGTARIRGHVLEKGSGAPIAGALVRVVGTDVSGQVTDSAGRFVSYGLPEGRAVLEVSHPDYETSECSASVPSEVDCMLVPTAVDGSLRVITVDRDEAPLPKMTVSVRGPSEHPLLTDGNGVATVDALAPGAYTAHVDDPAYLIAVRDFEIHPREETTVELRILPKPSRPRVVVRRSDIILRRQIGFATGSDEILPSSEPLLLEVADALIRNPDLELVEIQGHTDNRGNAAVNTKLSQRRAESVRQWLIRHGVGPARLIAKGYGSTRPIAPNITAYNRARNRRVQFDIVRRAVETDAEAR